MNDWELKKTLKTFYSSLDRSKEKGSAALALAQTLTCSGNAENKARQEQNNAQGVRDVTREAPVEVGRPMSATDVTVNLPDGVNAV